MEGWSLSTAPLETVCLMNHSTINVIMSAQLLSLLKLLEVTCWEATQIHHGRVS